MRKLRHFLSLLKIVLVKNCNVRCLTVMQHLFMWNDGVCTVSDWSMVWARFRGCAVVRSFPQTLRVVTGSRNLQVSAGA
jgi:hypothetical protein